MSKLSQSLFLAALGCVSFGGACSNDDAAPPDDVTYGLTITALDHGGFEDPVPLRCGATLAVTVSLQPAEQFALRPANACGESLRCGYFRLEGVDADGASLARVDTATSEGVLRLALDQLPALAHIRASLIRGFDQEPVLNPDQTPVEAIVSPTFVAPADCSVPDGSGGAGGETSSPGGAGGETSSPGGAAGQPAALGGAGGAPDLQPNGGAGAGGAPTEIIAGEGGVAGAQ
jgi:hypothetical protein